MKYALFEKDKRITQWFDDEGLALWVKDEMYPESAIVNSYDKMKDLEEEMKNEVFDNSDTVTD